MATANETNNVRSSPEHGSTLLCAITRYTGVTLFCVALVFRLLSRRNPPFYMQGLGFQYFVSTLFITGLLFYLCSRLTGAGMKVRLSPAVFAGLLFFAWVSFSTLFSTYPFSSTTALGIWSGHFAAFLLILLICTNDPLLLIYPLSTFCACSLWQLLYGAYQYTMLYPSLAKQIRNSPSVLDRAVAPEMQSEFQSRLFGHQPAGTLLNPNSFIALCTIGMMILIGIALYRSFESDEKFNPWGARFLVLAGVLFLPLMMVLSGSRGGQVAAIAAVAGTGFLYLKRHLGRIWWWGAGFLAAGGITFLLLIPSVNWQQFDLTSLTYRQWYTSSATEIASNHPATGVGLYNYQFYFTKHKPPCAEETRRTHNDFYDLAAETGWPGALLFLLFGTALFRPLVLTPSSSSPDGARPPPAEVTSEGGGDFGWMPIWIGVACIIGFLTLFGLNAGPMLGSHSFSLLWENLRVPLGRTVLLMLAPFLWGCGFALCFYLLRSTPWHASSSLWKLLVAAPLCFYAVHALVDIDLYVPAVASGLWMLAGLASQFNARGNRFALEYQINVRRQTGMAVSLVLFVLLVPLLLDAKAFFRSSVRLDALKADSRANAQTRLDTYRQILEKRPGDMILLQQISTFYHRSFCEQKPVKSSNGTLEKPLLNHFQTCLSFLNRAKRQMPHNWTVHRQRFRQIEQHRSRVRKKLGRVPENLPDKSQSSLSADTRYTALRQALNLYPTNASLLYRYGREQIDRDQPEKARRLFKRALHVDQCQNLERMRLSEKARSFIRKWQEE